jgi:hypothetical protein
MDSSISSTGAIMDALTMRIVEPLTVDFMTALYASYCNVHDIALDGNIEMNLSSIRLGLKIIFVGQLDDDHNDKPHIISNLNLYEFAIKDIDMQITAKGAVYDLECLPYNNGIASHPYNTTIGGLSVKAGYKLSTALEDLFKAINSYCR